MSWPAIRRTTSPWSLAGTAAGRPTISAAGNMTWPATARASGASSSSSRGCCAAATATGSAGALPAAAGWASANFS